jgi:outer membrane receptor protein involved in Fe transport
MRLLFSSIVALVCGAELLFSHTGTISGSVIDRSSRLPVAAANVVIEGTTVGASTDSNGWFVIPDMATGTYRLTASAVGYVKQTVTVAITGTDTMVIEFVLVTEVLNFEEVLVMGERGFSAASSTVLRTIDFELRPRQSAQDMLRMVPGLVIAQHAGGGKAEQIFLRGFDADHGTDVALSVDGVPVNMVSHGHGQGYADLHFIIPEVVQRIDVHKGPYFAQFGDMATAGAVGFRTRDALESNLISVEAGQFGTYRYLTMLQIPVASHSSSSYAAAEFFHTDGYFDSRISFNRYNVFAKFKSQVAENGALDIWASGFGSAWDASGQIPERAVSGNLIGRFGSIDPTEGGTTQRQNLSVSYLGSFENASTLLTQVYFSRYRFRLFSNFTFFRDDGENGDGIEQNDNRSIIGVRSEYSLAHHLGPVEATTTFGSGFRADEINVELWHSAERERLENMVSALVVQKNMSLFVQQELRFSPVVRLLLGLRGDYFVYDVEDKRKNTASPDISGYRQQTILSPKANLVVSPVHEVSLFANAGAGFHSNDARVVVTSAGDRTLPRAWGGEVGVRVTPFSSLTLSAAAWGLDLQSELVYVGDEGVFEPSGRTRRIGLDFDARAQILPWLFVDADLNISRGRFRDLPEGEDLIPLAPTMTATGGVTLRFPEGYGGSLRVRHINDRPANEDNTVIAKGSTIFDATVAYSVSRYRFQVTVENLFNAKWNEAQFDTESRLLDEPEAVSELHFTPGTPFNAKLKVEFVF